jgi:arylsulfatase A-like enzyme
MLGDRGIWDKRHFYEESVGVPLVLEGGPVGGEQRMSGARVSKALVSHLDLYPTLLELAGAKCPRHRKRPGRSLLGMLEGNTAGHPQVVAELATAMMIRTANWKLVFDPQAGGVQHLYNLAADPEELCNLAGQPGCEHVTLDLVQRLLEDKIRRSQTTHAKEEQRLQRVHIG